MKPIVRIGYLGLAVESDEGMALSIVYKKPKKAMKVRLTISRVVKRRTK